MDCHQESERAFTRRGGVQGGWRSWRGSLAQERGKAIWSFLKLNVSCAWLVPTHSSSHHLPQKMASFQHWQTYSYLESSFSFYINIPHILFFFGNRAGENPALPFLAWNHKSAVKADQRIARFFPIHINQHTWRKQVRDKFSILREINLFSLPRKCITLFAFILDEYKSTLKTLFICIFSVCEIYVSPLHGILLFFLTSRVSAIKVELISSAGNFTGFDYLLHYIIKISIISAAY